MSKRLALLATAVVSALALQVLPAGAVSLSLEIACAADYYAYCSQHDPDGQSVKKCFRVNGEKLSRRCLNALVAEGEVSKSEIEARSAKK
jgi:hypothetical protein